MVGEELAARVDHPERPGHVVVDRVEQVVVDPGAIERSRLVALVAGKAVDIVEGDVGDRVEAVEQHRLVVLALDEAFAGEHRLDRRGDRGLHPDRRAFQVGERPRPCPA